MEAFLIHEHYSGLGVQQSTSIGLLDYRELLLIILKDSKDILSSRVSHFAPSSQRLFPSRSGTKQTPLEGEPPNPQTIQAKATA